MMMILKLTNYSSMRIDEQISRFFPPSQSSYQEQRTVLGSKDLGFYVFRTLICIVGKP